MGRYGLEGLDIDKAERHKLFWENLGYDKPFLCGVCNDKFHHKKDLKRHKEEEHAI